MQLQTRPILKIRGQIVSILTRPGGRVQLCRMTETPMGFIMFQSSPVPKDGCNENGAVRYGAAVSVSILTRPEGRVQLGKAMVALLERREFQSSPVPKDGCNQQNPW